MSMSSPDKITRLIVICCLLSVSVANPETCSSVTADTVNADTVNTDILNATTGNVTTLNAAHLTVAGGGTSLDVADLSLILI